MKEDFIDWLNKELINKGWNNTELVKRSGLANSTVSMALSKQSNIGYNFCVGVGRALNIPPEMLMRKAGLLPTLTIEDAYLEKVTFLIDQLSEEKKQLLLNTLHAWTK